MKQDPFAGAYRARTSKELAEMFMNPNAPKTEAEHWAVREIEKLRAEVERLREALEMIRDADNDCRSDGLPTMPELPRRKIDAALAMKEGGR